MMPLTFAKIGENIKIKRVGGKDEVKRHLNSLGFVEGNTICIVNEMAGNFIIGVKDSRVAISKEMANRIVVENI